LGDFDASGGVVELCGGLQEGVGGVLAELAEDVHVPALNLAGVDAAVEGRAEEGVLAVDALEGPGDLVEGDADGRVEPAWEGGEDLLLDHGSSCSHWWASSACGTSFEQRTQ